MTLEPIPAPLSKLIETGSCRSSSIDPLLDGIVHRCNDGKNWVISQTLLAARQQLNSDNELIAAVLCRDPDVRNAWAKLCAGRCQEAGGLNDPGVLIQAITNLGDGAQWVDEQLNNANLNATGHANLERSLFGNTAEHQQSTPALIRVVAAGYQLSRHQQDSLEELINVDMKGQRPDVNWIDGRLIHLPGARAREFQYLLSGTADIQPPRDANGKDGLRNVMAWVLGHPWAYLLALIAYEQNVWQIEASGALLLELPSGQSPHQPSEVQVLVANADGDEVYCGNLGEYCARILSGLGMALFPATASVAELNAQLSAVVENLLTYRVWQYVEGLSGTQGYYQIHPAFSDLCYGIQGQPSFSRYARVLRRVIREEANTWRQDRQTMRGNNLTTKAQAA